LLVKVPRHAQAMVASLVRTIFAQERPQDAWAQLERVVEQLHAGRFTDAAGLLERAAPDVLAYTAFPRDVWKKCWSNNHRSGWTRDPPPLGRGRDLPVPRRGHPPGRCRAGRAA
jgi:transposase-like protein